MESELKTPFVIITLMFWEALMDIIFPPQCLICEKDVLSTKIVCESCFSRIDINDTFFCGKCGSRMAMNKRLCHFDFPYILGAAGSYKNEVLKNLIKGMKFRSIKMAADPLSELLIRYAREIDFSWQNFLVIPMPLSKQRERRRGFNQSELIAEGFAKNIGLPFENNILVRHKNSTPQSELKNWENREENVRDCFSVKTPEIIKNRNVVLIDDVLTSGSTMLSAANILKEAGVKRLVALVLAKA